MLLMESARTDFLEIFNTRESIHFWFLESVNRPSSAFKNVFDSTLNFKDPSKTCQTLMHK